MEARALTFNRILSLRRQSLLANVTFVLVILSGVGAYATDEVEGSMYVFLPADTRRREKESALRCGLSPYHLSTTDSSIVKNSGNEMRAESAPRIVLSPSARNAAMEKAMAIR